MFFKTTVENTMRKVNNRYTKSTIKQTAICRYIKCIVCHETPMSNGVLGFYRATACNATHGIAVGILSVRLSVCPSVCPSVRQIRVL